MITIAHLSDLHLDSGPRAAERADRVVSFLRTMPGPVDLELPPGLAFHVLDDGNRLTTHFRFLGR
jgi:hypothetical protein